MSFYREYMQGWQFSGKYWVIRGNTEKCLEILGNTHMRTNKIVKWVISNHGTDGLISHPTKFHLSIRHKTLLVVNFEYFHNFLKI